MDNLDSRGFELPGASPQQPAYNAGGQGRRLRAWRPTNAGPNTVSVTSLSLIRARSRAAHRNDPWAGTAADKYVSNLVGTGIVAKAVNGSAILKAAIKKVWDRWCKYADADGVLDFYGLQALMAGEWEEGGEVFVRLRSRRLSDGLPVPLQLQVIEAEQCPAEYYTTASNGNPVRAGIEFNAIGQRVAYWMYQFHPGDVVGTTQGNQLVRIPAEQVIHLYQPLRAGQLRGVPRSAPVLVRMYNLDTFDDAVLERQKIANLFGVFFKTPNPEEGAGPLSESAHGQDPDGTPLAALEPGTSAELPPGWDVEFATPPDAGSAYPEFLRAQLMAIAAKHGVPYEVLTGDLRNVSDRALKLILNEFRRWLEQHQWLYLIPQALQPIREAFFDAAVLGGVLDLPDYADLREDYVETLWVPQGWPYSHPVQDVDADIKAIAAGLKSRDAVVLANGDDPETVDAQNVEANKRADAAGLAYTSDGRQATKSMQPVVPKEPNEVINEPADA